MAILTTQKYCEMTFQNEGQFTASTNMYISQNYEVLRGMYFHIPNESATSDLMRIKLAAMGVLPGVPDFRFEAVVEGYNNKHIPILIPAWYLELKQPGKTLSEAQRRLHGKWIVSGIDIEVAWKPAEVCAFLQKRYGQPEYL